MAKTNYLTEKNIVIDLIKNDFPTQVAMIEKNWKRYTTVIDYLVTNIPDLKNKTILDYGCGFPIVVKILKLLGYTITGYEPYAGSAEKNMAKIVGVEDIYFTSLENDKKFDVVIMVDVIEHLSIIKPIMKDVYSKTASKGYLVVSTPNVLRWEMWSSFIMRKTGHPLPLLTFLNSDDNYTNHQREFTLQELKTTLKHFGFRIIHATIKDTQPDKELLLIYHQLLGKYNQTTETGFKSKIKSGLAGFMKRLFPGKLTNNLLIIGQKT